MGERTHIPERRQFGRRRVAVEGMIELPLRPLLPCRVLDISPIGAQLEVDGLAWLPSKFRLITGRNCYECAVRHRDCSIVGVVFLL